jgi:hypothetical protein
MLAKTSRRSFVGSAAAVSLCSLIPRLAGASTAATRKIGEGNGATDGV